MSLNKRTGLYSMPSHHLHIAKTTPRPTFNSMDFAAEETNSPSGGVQSVQQVKKENTAPQEHKDKKKKRRHSTSADGKHQLDSRAPATLTPLIKVTPATASPKFKKDKGAAKSDKKRKRESEDGVDSTAMLPKSSSNGGFIVGADILKNIQSSVKAAGEVFSSKTTTFDVTEEPSKKKSKKDKSGRKSSDTVDFDRMAKETRSIDRKARKEEKARRQSAGATPARAQVALPVPSPPIFSSPPPRKTPVPLPQNAFSHAANADRIGRRDSRLLVQDTPPSQLLKTPVMLPDSPIPFRLAKASKKKEHKSSKKLADHSPPTAVVVEAPSSAPPAVNKNPKLQLKPDGRVSLTSSNLMKNMTTTQPLSDGPKPRPKPLAQAASTAGSTTSGGTTPSIKDHFARVGKPGAEVNPFIVAKPKTNPLLELHQELTAAAFTTRFLAAQQTIHFPTELAHHAQATTWRTTNAALGPLPCLGQKASGCNTKRETILRLSRCDPSSHLTVSVATDADTAALASAKTNAAVAESFLARALAARVPVPLGAVHGTWQLFCPAYSDAHVDKYGYGQRTLRIFSSPSTSPGMRTYTARLSIPPRSMLYPLRPFTAPPHASFRTTTLRTSAEGYAMDVLFLGNGYLLLRVDLRLLLSGKEGGEGGRSTVMEFLGVREGAVRWEGEEAGGEGDGDGDEEA